MKKEQFDLIYPIIELMLSQDKRFRFEPKWEYRKNEWVFGATMMFEDSNLKLQDYACVFFSDGDDEAKEDGYFGFGQMKEDIEEFIKRAKSL